MRGYLVAGNWKMNGSNAANTELLAGSIAGAPKSGEVELLVTEETNPCARMDEQHQGLTAALTADWRGGICCNVSKPGAIKIGDQVEFD